MGHKVQKEIQESGGAYSGESEANIGKILGIAGTVVLLMVVAMWVFVIIGVVTGFLDA